MSQMQNLYEVSKDLELIGEEITVFGDVHQGSIIDSHKLFVKGVVHSDATQFSKYANIQEHHGVLRCHEAIIHTLDNGEVNASKLTIDTCRGGKIYAQDVHIKHVSGQVQIYASNSITIDSVDDSENIFTINYTQVPILVSKVELIQEDIEELIFLLKKVTQSNAPTQKDIEDEIKRLKKELIFIQESHKFAKITIKNSINVGNLISFNIDMNHNISYTTQKKQYEPFHLECNNKTIKLLPTQTIITL